MKNIKILVAIFLVLLLIIGGIYAWHFRPIASTDLGNETLAKIKIAGEEKHLQRQYPELAMDMDSSYRVYYYNDKSDFKVTTIDSKVIGIECIKNIKGQSIKTNKGVTIGTTSDEVKRKYGENYRARSSDRWDYVWIYEDKNNQLSLVFGIDGKGKVTAISLYNNKKYDFQI